MITDVDPDDVPFLAFALHLVAGLWSGDEHVQEQNRIEVWRRPLTDCCAHLISIAARWRSRLYKDPSLSRTSSIAFSPLSVMR